MDETIETLMIGVRADTASFAQDAAAMQASLQASLGDGADKAGSLIEDSLAKVITTGKAGFADLEKSAVAALGEIAAQAVSNGLASLLGGVSGGGGLATIGSSLIGALLGSPGRATGGPVSPGRPYMVGEQGPELFVPASAGSIAPAAGNAAPRAVNVAISINAPAATEPQALARSSRQVARAVNRALAQAER